MSNILLFLLWSFASFLTLAQSSLQRQDEYIGLARRSPGEALYQLPTYKRYLSEPIDLFIQILGQQHRQLEENIWNISDLQLREQLLESIIDTFPIIRAGCVISEAIGLRSYSQVQMLFRKYSEEQLLQCLEAVDWNDRTFIHIHALSAAAGFTRLIFRARNVDEEVRKYLAQYLGFRYIPIPLKSLKISKYEIDQAMDDSGIIALLPSKTNYVLSAEANNKASVVSTACSEGRAVLLPALADRGISVSRVDSDARNCAHRAAAGGFADILAMLPDLHLRSQANFIFGSKESNTIVRLDENGNTLPSDSAVIESDTCSHLPAGAVDAANVLKQMGVCTPNLPSRDELLAGLCSGTNGHITPPGFFSSSVLIQKCLPGARKRIGLTVSRKIDSPSIHRALANGQPVLIEGAVNRTDLFFTAYTRSRLLERIGSLRMIHSQLPYPDHYVQVDPNSNPYDPESYMIRLEHFVDKYMPSSEERKAELNSLNFPIRTTIFKLALRPVPHYIFDDRAASRILGLVSRELARELVWRARGFYQSDVSNGDSDPNDPNDISNEMEEVKSIRKIDLVQMAMGPPGSGAMPHFHGPAVNFNFVGRKLWIMVPPGDAFFDARAPSIYFFAALALYSETFGTCAHDVLLSNGKMSLDECEKLEDAVREIVMSEEEFGYFGHPIAFVQAPGDIVVVPNNWGHAVLNLDDSLAFAIE